MNRKNLFTILFAIVIVLAIFFRFFQLGINPPSLDWDEASLGYNAYSILKTGADEYGNFLPLSIRSFDDYKPPLYVYLTVPSIAVFGLTEFAVRLPSAVFGVLSVVVMYFLVLELLNTTALGNVRNRESIAVTSAFFVAISPWHLQFSRAAFEGNIGLFFLLLGVLLFLFGLKKHPAFLVGASISFVLAIYSYHSFRLIVPLLIASLCILFLKEIQQRKRFLLIAFILFVLLSLPIFKSFIGAQGSRARLSMVTIFDSEDILKKPVERFGYDASHGDIVGTLLHNRRIVYGLAIAKGYLDHWNPDFLFLHGDGGRQHHAVDMGMLYLWDLPFLVIGFIVLMNRLNRRNFLLLLLLFLAPLPAAITTGTPHPVRAIAMIPSLHMLTAIGVVFFFLKLYQMKRFLAKVLGVGIIGLFMFNFVYYMHQYYIHTPIEYGDFWQYGNKEAVLFAKQNESKYDHIIMTYHYDQPYIYYLFYNKIDPKWYQKHWDDTNNGIIERMVRVIGKYEFRNINWTEDQQRKNTLFIGIPKELPENIPSIKEIMFPDGSTAFRLVKT